MNELMMRGLPKWPQMIVTGTKVTKEQAEEIIRRTDSFYTWGLGNNHWFIEEAKIALCLPEEPEGRLGTDEYFKLANEYYEKKNAFLEAIGFINTNYVENDWISCSCFGGPHGWCHPDGEIGYCNNIGKWPSVEEVFNDFVKIAAAWPFLELEVTLMNKEECEEDSKPVVSFLIRNGTVEPVDPAERNLREEFNRSFPKSTPMFDDENEAIIAILDPSNNRENAIPMETLIRWGEINKEACKSFHSISKDT